MDKVDFIQHVCALYPHQVKEGLSAKAYFDRYSRALKGLDVNYERLIDLFTVTYTGDYPPSGKEIKEMALKCPPDVDYCGEWLHVKLVTPQGNIRNTDCFRAGTSLETIRATYKRMFNSDKFEILEVN